MPVPFPVTVHHDMIEDGRSEICKNASPIIRHNCVRDQPRGAGGKPILFYAGMESRKMPIGVKGCNLLAGGLEFHFDFFGAVSVHSRTDSRHIACCSGRFPLGNRHGVVTKPLDEQPALLLGDAINNCRQALDHAFAAAIGATAREREQRADAPYVDWPGIRAPFF
jgi:hypothetical protein